MAEKRKLKQIEIDSLFRKKIKEGVSQSNTAAVRLEDGRNSRYVIYYSLNLIQTISSNAFSIALLYILHDNRS